MYISILCLCLSWDVCFCAVTLVEVCVCFNKPGFPVRLKATVFYSEENGTIRKVSEKGKDVPRFVFLSGTLEEA